jgi:actin-related protein
MMEATAVVIDNGSYMSKAGFAGQDNATYEFHSTVGLHRYFTNRFEFERFRGSYVGDEAHNRRSVLTLSHPIERGTITNWDDMEKVI